MHYICKQLIVKTVIFQLTFDLNQNDYLQNGVNGHNGNDYERYTFSDQGSKTCVKK